MSNVESAVESFKSGCACSQAVFAAYATDLGLTRDQALRLAAGFGGGMRMAETCGAVTGALMVLGLRHSGPRSDNAEGRAAIYAKVTDYTKRYREQCGSVICRELLGCDISTPQGATKARETGLFQTKCPELVRAAAQLLEQPSFRGGF